MKKILLVVMLGCAIAAMAQEAPVATVQEEEEKVMSFAYDAGLDVVSAYLWRGQYLGGLSAQPTLDVGWDSEHTSFRFGAWANLGASDWKFQKEATYFVPEVDVLGTVNIYGVTLGFTHYYYFGGSNFFSGYNMKQWKEWALAEDENFDKHTSTTELSFGYDFSTLGLCGLYLNWNVTISGHDFKYVYDENDNLINIHRNYSSYIELGYNHEFEDYGLTLGGFVGMVPWGSELYYNDKFAVTCLSLRLDKEWEFDACSLDLYAQGMMNPTGINKENAYINEAGEAKLDQRLNACVGLGIWF